MKNFLFLLVLTSSLRAAWYEGPEDQGKLELRGGGGGYRKEKEHDHKTFDSARRQDLYVPCCYSRGKTITVPERRLSTTDMVNPIVSRVAQNIDVGPLRRGLWEIFLAWWNNLMSPAPQRPPRFTRQPSYYPGRSDTQVDPFRTN